MTTTQKDQHMDRRKLISYLAKSGGQLRFSIPFILFTLLNISIVKIINIQILQEVKSIDANSSQDELLVAIYRLSNHASAVIMIGMAVIGVVAYLSWLIYSHKIFGPIVRIRRHVQDLLKGEYEKPLTLRRHDEFKDLAEDLNQLTTKLKNQVGNSRGVTLIELLVAVAIMGVVVQSMSSIFVGQVKQIKALSQKQEIIDLKNVMIKQLAIPEVCNWQLQNKIINVSGPPTESSPSPSVVSLTNNTLFSGPNPASAVIAREGQPLPSTQSNLIVESVKFKNIYATGNSEEYKGVFEIVFSSPSLVFSVRPVQVQQLIKTVASDPPTAKRIESCAGGSGLQFTNVTFHTFCNTGLGGQVLKPHQSNRICTLSAMDDDVGASVVVPGGAEYKCRVGRDATSWRGIAPLSCGHVACIATCFDL